MAEKTLETNFFFADTKEKQRRIKKDLQDLFLEVFKKPLLDSQWEHFYLNGPCGQTVSFTYFDGDVMRAHGGLIPQLLISKSGEKIGYFLQTAIMVRKKHQNLLLFKKLLDTMDSYVTGRKSFVIAFPNQNTYLPFVKMLRWKMVREYTINQYVLKEGVAAEDEPRDEHDFRYEIYKDKAFMKWRRELNEFSVIKTEKFEVIYKDYKGSLELLDVFIKDKDFRIPLRGIMRQLGYQQANVAGCFSGSMSFKDLILSGTVGIPQRMCFYPSQHEEYGYGEIKPSLLLSDVF